MNFNRKSNLPIRNTINLGRNDDTKGVIIGERSINNLWFAADTLLVAESEEEWKELVNHIEEKSLEQGLEINVNLVKIRFQQISIAF